MHGQLVRLRPGECLVHGQEPVEPLAGDPALLVNELASEHRDLGDRAAEREQPETDEPTEDREWWGSLGAGHRRDASRSAATRLGRPGPRPG